MWRKKTASERKMDTVDRMVTLEGLLKAVDNLHDHLMMCEGSWGHIGIQEYDSQWMTEDNLTDVEADADTLASAGWGTDEDYGG